MLVWPASRRLHGAVSVAGGATGARLIRKQKLQNGLEEIRIELQWDMDKGQVRVLDGDHGVSWVYQAEKFVLGANIRAALRNAVGARDDVQPELGRYKTGKVYRGALVKAQYDDEGGHTRNWMCALNRVMEDSITCCEGKIRIARPLQTGVVVVGNGACRLTAAYQVRPRQPASDEAYSQG